MEEAKEVHKCLRTAAGIFTVIKVVNLNIQNFSCFFHGFLVVTFVPSMKFCCS